MLNRKIDKYLIDYYQKSDNANCFLSPSSAVVFTMTVLVLQAASTRARVVASNSWNTHSKPAGGASYPGAAGGSAFRTSRRLRLCCGGLLFRLLGKTTGLENANLGLGFVEILVAHLEERLKVGYCSLLFRDGRFE